MKITKGHRHKYAATFFKTFIALVLILLWTVPAYAGKQVFEKVQVAELADSVQINISASRPMTIHSGWVKQQHLFFDLNGYLGKHVTRQFIVNDGGIKTVKCGWYKNSPPIVRIVVSTSRKLKYSVNYFNGRRAAVITIFKTNNAVKKPAIDSFTKASASAKFVVNKTSEIEEPIITLSAPVAEVKPVLPSSSASEVVSLRPNVSAEAQSSTPITLVASTPVAELKPTVTESKPILVASAAPIGVSNAVVAAATADANKPAKRITLDFVGTDIHDVLKALSTESGVNIVASPDVKGEVTVALSNVTVEEALKLVANLSGYKYAQVEGAYVVGTAENLKALAAGGASFGDEKVTEVVVLKYADSDMVTKMLETQFAAVKATTSKSLDKDAPKTNVVLVLTGPAGEVKAAKAFVDQVEQSLADKAQTSVMEVYEVKYADINELAALLQACVPGVKVVIGPNQGFDLEKPSALAMGNTSEGGSAGQNAQPKKEAPPKTLLITGTPEEINKAKEFLAKVDVQQPQILIEAKVVDIRNEFAKDLGIEWEWSRVSFNERHVNDVGQEPPVVLGHFQRSPMEIIATINALVDDGKAKVLANPNVLALDGKPASIFIGDEIKYVVSVQVTTTGVNVTTETARVGVQLHVVSRVSSDGYITMDLHPEASVIKSFLKTPADLLLPEISRRFIDSTVRVKDGETIVIGGLITEEDRERMTGIPFLSDLPIIGGLFKNKHNEKIRSEIMMFITPKIVGASK